VAEETKWTKLKTPEWLKTYKKRTAIIDVIAMAFDSKISDKKVRNALKEVSQTMGEMFAPPGEPEG